MSRTTLGIFTNRAPLQWRARASEKVDVCLVVLSPPGGRRLQLWMLGRLARMSPTEDFLTRLRAETTQDGLRAVVSAADKELDQFLGGGETEF